MSTFDQLTALKASLGLSLPQTEPEPEPETKRPPCAFHCRNKPSGKRGGKSRDYRGAVPATNKPMAGEIGLKDWLWNWATRNRMTFAMAFRRWRNGQLKPKSVRRVNARVIYVTI